MIMPRAVTMGVVVLTTGAMDMVLVVMVVVVVVVRSRGMCAVMTVRMIMGI